jgi:hypothetical protein
MQLGAAISPMMTRKVIIKIYIMQESFDNSLDFQQNSCMLQFKVGFVLEVFWKTLKFVS